MYSLKSPDSGTLQILNEILKQGLENMMHSLCDENVFGPPSGKIHPFGGGEIMFSFLILLAQSPLLSNTVSTEISAVLVSANVLENMKLGVYRRPAIEDDDPVYTRLALYDFDTGEWGDDSDGTIVSKTSADPSPEEVKVRFDLDPDARRTVVSTPELMEQAGHVVELGEPSISVEEGRAKRDERGGPLMTQTERQAQRQQGYRVFPADHDLSEEAKEFYESRGETVITELEWEFAFADEYNLNFDSCN